MAVVAALLMSTSIFVGIIGAQTSVPPLPFNEQTGECIPFNQSPLSLKEVDGVNAPGFINPHDLDGDGYTNAQEFLATSDPTDSQSTPLDVDGDGFTKAEERDHPDGCDYDPTRPADVLVTLVTDLPDAVERGFSSQVLVRLENADEQPVSGATVALDVRQTGDARDTVSLAENPAGSGEYTGTFAVGLGDPADPEDPWIVDVTATVDGATYRLNPGGALREDQREHIEVSPTTFDVPIEILHCVGTACFEREVFFEGEIITIRATPDKDKFHESSPKDGSATLVYSSDIVVDGVSLVAGPEGEESMTRGVNEAGDVIFQVSFDPAAHHVPPPQNLVFPTTEFHFTVEVEDDAGSSTTGSLPNTGESVTKDAGVAFFDSAKELVFQNIPEDAVLRKETITIVVEYQEAGQRKKAPSGAVVEADIYAADDENRPTTDKITTTPVPLVEGIDGVFTGTYTIGIGDPMTTQPFLSSHYLWFIDARMTFPTDPAGAPLETRGAEYPVNPTEVDVSIADPGEGEEFTVSVSEGGVDMQSIPVVVVLPGTVGVDYHDDDGLGPGVASATLADPNGVPIASTSLTWDTTELRFEGSFDFADPDEQIAAAAFPGEWTLEVEFEDDADAPNEGFDSRTIVVNREVSSGAAQVVYEPPTIAIDNLYGWNKAEWDGTQWQGQTGDLTVDRDDITTTNPTTSHRFIVVEGKATDGVIDITDENGASLVDGPHPRPVSGVFVQFNGRQLQVDTSRSDQENMFLPYHQEALKDASIGGESQWRILFDTLGRQEVDAAREGNPDWPPIEQDAPVAIEAFAYVGPVAYTVRNDENTRVEQFRVAPLGHVPGDASGTYSAAALASVQFDYKGPSTIEPSGIVVPTGAGDVDLFGGGPVIYTDAASGRELTVLVDTSHIEDVDVVKAELLFANVIFRNCESGDSASEWCINEAYTKVGGSPAYEPMMAHGVPGQWELVVDGPLNQDTSSGKTERFWAKPRITNEFGYVTTASPPLPEVDGGADTTASFPQEQGLFAGLSFTQFTFQNPEVKVTKIAGLSGQRSADQRTAGTPFDWVDGMGSHASLEQIHKDRGVLGFVAGDSITIDYSVDAKNTLPDQSVTHLPPSDLSNFVNVAQFHNTRGVTSSDGTTISDTLVPDPGATTKAASFSLNTANAPEQVGVWMDPWSRISLTVFNSYGVKEVVSPFVAIDRNAAPDAQVFSIVMDDQDGPDHGFETISSPASGTTVKGTINFNYEGFDLDGVDPTLPDPTATPGDPRLLDGFQSAFSYQALGPDVEDTVHVDGVTGKEHVIVDLPMEISREGLVLSCHDDDQPGHTFTSTTTPCRYKQISVYLPPLRVGFDPLFLEIGDINDPSSWAIDPEDRVFGIDTTTNEEDGFVGTRSSHADWNPFVGTLYDDLAGTALELNLHGLEDGDPDDAPGPYIGFTYHDGIGTDTGTSYAIAVDRGFRNNPTSSAQDGPLSGNMEPTEWDIFECTMRNINNNNGGLTLFGVEVVPGARDACPLLDEYQYIGIVNGLTPITIFAPNQAFGNDPPDTCPIGTTGTNYPDPDGNPGECYGRDTNEDFADGDKQDGYFPVPRGFFWIRLDGTFASLSGSDGNAGLFTDELVTMHPYEELRLADPRVDQPDDIAKDMVFPDGTYTVTIRGLDGVEVISEPDGGSNDDGPFTDFTFVVNNDFDDDGYSDALEHKIRDQIRDGSHRQFSQNPTGYRGSQFAFNPLGLPLSAGSVAFTHPTLGRQEVTAAESTPCDWDGDGIPNDFMCLGKVDIEAAFNTNPFVWDTPFDDPNGNGIPSFMDPAQSYRFDCKDTDGDTWCDHEEEQAGSDPEDADSVPGDTDGDGVPDNLEAFAELVVNRILDEVGPVLEGRITFGPPAPEDLRTEGETHTVRATPDPDAPDEYVFIDVREDGFFVIGQNDGSGEKVIAGSNTVDQAVGLVLGLAFGAVGTALDADGDGWSNHAEIVGRSSPIDPCSTPTNTHGVFPWDLDGDGYSNHSELLLGTDPLDACSNPMTS